MLTNQNRVHLKRYIRYSGRRADIICHFRFYSILFVRPLDLHLYTVASADEAVTLFRSLVIQSMFAPNEQGPDSITRCRLSAVVLSISH